LVATFPIASLGVASRSLLSFLQSERKVVNFPGGVAPAPEKKRSRRPLRRVSLFCLVAVGTSEVAATSLPRATPGNPKFDLTKASLLLSPGLHCRFSTCLEGPIPRWWLLLSDHDFFVPAAEPLKDTPPGLFPILLRDNKWRFSPFHSFRPLPPCRPDFDWPRPI